MSEYPKIQSVFKRDPATNRFIIGAWSMPELAYLHDRQWVWDEKIDGTNIRVVWDGFNRKFQGKTDNASIPAHLFARLEDLFPADKLKARFEATHVILYGEGFGAKIQKGGSYLPDRCDFILFDVRIGHWWLERADVEDIASKLGLRITTVLGEGTIDQAIEAVRAGFKSAIGTADAEGLILRPKVQLFNRQMQRVITKVKTRDFR